MSLTPDIPLGPGDTAPILVQTLTAPNKPDGSRGDPLDLTGCTVTFKYQPRGASVAAVERPVALASDPTTGGTSLDWLATGGRLDAGGNVNGLDFNARYLVLYPSGHQISIPNGMDPFFGETEIREFLWLRVAADFTVVT